MYRKATVVGDWASFHSNGTGELDDFCRETASKKIPEADRIKVSQRCAPLHTMKHIRCSKFIHFTSTLNKLKIKLIIVRKRNKGFGIAIDKTDKTMSSDDEGILLPSPPDPLERKHLGADIM